MPLRVTKDKFASAFTLAEVLFVLVIWGGIVTFTIPKLLISQQNQKFKAIAKESMASIAEAYQLYQKDQTPPSSFKPKDLLPYLNYVRYDTATTNAFDYPFAGQGDCSAASPCVYLHNGSLIQLYADSFAGTSNTNMVWMLVDPDSSRINSPSGGGIEFALYYNGRLADWPGITPNSVCSWGTYSPDANGNPTWFNW